MPFTGCPMTRLARTFPQRLPVLTALLLAASCAPETATAPQAASVDTVEFDADDRRAAQALSIGNQAALTGAATAYDRALLCSIALDSLTEQLQERGALTAEQQRAFGEVRRLYERRLDQSAGSKTAEERSRDREQAEEANPEPSTRAQIAIGCLRQLQQPS